MPLVGNKFIERDLRDWLDEHDHYGRSAEVEELELAAVQRPGWVQVFRFRVKAKHKASAEWRELRGLIRDDERAKKKADRTAYRLTDGDAAHDAAFAEWSDGLLKLRTGAPGEARGGVLLAVLAALGAVGLVGFALSRAL